MERHFDDELEKFNTNLLKMAALTENAIHRSVEALKNQDKEMAQKVIEDDKQIDDMENQIEEEAIDLLALFQPMAKDLRSITTGMKINAELERIADLCENVCHRVLETADEPLLKPLIDLPLLAENAKKMLKNAIDSFVQRNEEVAKNVILSDERSNELRSIIMKELIYDYMVKDGTTAPRAVALLLITRDLERISDHAVAIAEDVIYMIRAKVVKHHLSSLKEILTSETED